MGSRGFWVSPRVWRKGESEADSPICVCVCAEYVPIGPRFSNGVLQALIVLLAKRPPKVRPLVAFLSLGAADPSLSRAHRADASSSSRPPRTAKC